MVTNVAYARYEKNPARQEAYRLWSEDVSRSTMSLLPAIEAATGEKVAYRTVQEWRHRDQWELRYAQEQAAASGVLVIEHVRKQRVAAPSASDYLTAVREGREPYDRGRVEIAKFQVEQANKLLTILPIAEQVMPDALPTNEADLLALEPEWTPGT
jgi:hypothetical protein